MDDARQQLDDLGYVLLPNVMDATFLREINEQVNRLFESEGQSAGAEFKQEAGTRRLANLVNKAQVFRDIMVHDQVLPFVSHVLRDRVKLSSINARSVSPHWQQGQPLHCDMGALPDDEGPWVCNTVWLLDDFTVDNGALRVVPRTHRSGQLPQDALPDASAPHPDQAIVTGPAGSVIIMNAHLWHGGTANRTDRWRTAVHAFYCRRDKPQQQYQKDLVADKVQRLLRREERDLLALDDPLNDQLAAGQHRRSGFLN